MSQPDDGPTLTGVLRAFATLLALAAAMILVALLVRLLLH